MLPNIRNRSCVQLVEGQLAADRAQLPSYMDLKLLRLPVEHYKVILVNLLQPADDVEHIACHRDALLCVNALLASDPSHPSSLLLRYASAGSVMPFRRHRPPGVRHIRSAYLTSVAL